MDVIESSIISEICDVKNIIKTIPKDNIIDIVSFQYRLHKLYEELADHRKYFDISY